MRELGKQKRQAFYHQFLHQELMVLVEDRREKETGRWKGFSRNYIPVALACEDELQRPPDWINQEVIVKVTDTKENGLVGQILER
jgi:tRNA A37 methylthiotransferase MiaB